MMTSAATRALRRLGVGIGCCLAAACSEPPSDGDGDGFDKVEDCNDANADVSPGATEVCGDGLDNDCDLDVDEADADCGGGSGG